VFGPEQFSMSLFPLQAEQRGEVAVPKPYAETSPSANPFWTGQRMGAFVTIMLMATGLRLIGLHSQSLTMDECFERSRTEMSLMEVIHDANSFPPLYHIVLKGWRFLDDSESSLRTFSLLCGLLSLVGLFWMVNEVVDETVAWWALLIAAVSPFHIYYSQEGRVYMLYLLLASLALGTMLLWVRDHSRMYLWGFIGTAVVGGYVHYFFAVVLVTLGIVAGMVLGWRFLWQRLLPVGCVIGLACAPLLLLIENDLHYQRNLDNSRPLDMASAGYTYFSLVSGYTLGVSRTELQILTPAQAIHQTLPWILSLLAVISPLVVLGVMRLRKHWSLGVWLGMLVIPMGLLWLICVALEVTYNTRFLVWLWIPFCVMLAAGIAQLRSMSLRLAGFGLMVLFSGVAIYNRQFVARYVNEDVRAAASYLLESEPRPILVSAAYMRRPLQFYLGEERKAWGIGPAKPGEAINDAEADSLRRSPIWLVYTRQYHGDPDGEILADFLGEQVATPAFEAAGVKVYACQPNSDNENNRGTKPNASFADKRE